MWPVFLLGYLVSFNLCYLTDAGAKTDRKPRLQQGLSLFMEDLERFGVLEKEALQETKPVSAESVEMQPLKTWDSIVSDLFSPLSSAAGLMAVGNGGFGVNDRSSPYGPTPEDFRRFEQNRLNGFVAYGKVKAGLEKKFQFDEAAFLQSKPN